jgi:hypothetical protein
MHSVHVFFKGWRCQKGGDGSEQGSALHALNDEHGSKAQHGCAAVDHLSLGGEGFDKVLMATRVAIAFFLLAIALDDHASCAQRKLHALSCFSFQARLCKAGQHSETFMQLLLFAVILHAKHPSCMG